jgi:1,4-alpha-glucan branching enzyme
MIHTTCVRAPAGYVVRVTFTLPRETCADAVYLVGEFNDWDRSSHPFARDRDGAWSLTVDLELDRAYPFFYLCDGEWKTDGAADGYIRDTSGKHLFLVVTTGASADVSPSVTADGRAA